jgi:hypothetical protein
MIKKATHQPSIAALVLLLLPCFCGRAEAQSVGAAAFQRLDKNGDGKLTRDEVPNAQNFAAADADKNGLVSLDEFRRHVGLRPNQAATPTNPESVAQPAANPSALFALKQRISIASGPLAVGVLDANLDGRPDLVLPSSRNSGRFDIALNRNDVVRGMVFEIQTLPMSDASADQSKLRSTKGLGLHDFNADGKMDIYLANRDGGGPSLGPDGQIRQPRGLASSSNSAQLSNGDGTFITRDLGINSRGSEVRSVLFADFDGDGHTDSFHVVSPYYGPGWGGSPVGNELHAGTSEWHRFGPDMIRGVLPDPGFWQDQHGRAIKMFKGTLARDFDGDGKPDLITGAYADIWGGSMKRLQTPEDAKLDLDKDGIPDTTWPGGWDRGLFLLHNVSEPGRIRFEEVGNQAIERAWSDGTRYPQMHVYSIVAIDLDHDADFDLVVTGVRNSSAHRSLEDTTPIARVLRNECHPGEMRFTDITATAGLDFLNVKQVPGYPLTQRAPNLAACAPIDFDNDGHTDLVFVDRQDGLPGDDPRLRPWVFRNSGRGSFERLPADEHGLEGHFNDLSYADFDSDGRLDLVFVHGDPDGSGKAAIYRNTSTGNNHWVQINLTAPGNPFGLESKVTVFKHGTEEILGYDEVRTDFCYRSKKSTTLHFGLGLETFVDVRVRTRSGLEQTFENLPVDKSHALTLSQP